jgi:hypothetical protein
MDLANLIRELIRVVELKPSWEAAESGPPRGSRSSARPTLFLFHEHDCRGIRVVILGTKPYVIGVNSIVGMERGDGDHYMTIVYVVPLPALVVEPSV